MGYPSHIQVIFKKFMETHTMRKLCIDFKIFFTPKRISFNAKFSLIFFKYSQIHDSQRIQNGYYIQ